MVLEPLAEHFREEKLFIHKNTLQYRIRRLLAALGLDRCGSFQQEFLVRLLWEHNRRKQGRQALE